MGQKKRISYRWVKLDTDLLPISITYIAWTIIIEQYNSAIQQYNSTIQYMMKPSLPLDLQSGDHSQVCGPKKNVSESQSGGITAGIPQKTNLPGYVQLLNNRLKFSETYYSPVTRKLQWQDASAMISTY